MHNQVTKALCVSTFVLLLGACATQEKEKAEAKQTLQVTATAYNSVESQTKPGDSVVTAWGDQLEPGMKAIAVSRDLIEAGLDYNTPVEIEGLPGTYRVLDKMNKRWNKRIDIYMGNDVAEAREWGKQTVEISWQAN